MSVQMIGLDIAKSVFQVHGVDSAGQPVLRKRLARGQLAVFLPSCPLVLSAWRPVPALIIGRGN
jgi:transposase